MDRMGIELHLARVAEARAEWDSARKTFNAQVETIMSRLLPEAAVKRMSVERIAELSGYTPRQVRQMFRACGLSTKNRSMLARSASEALESNAALLGIDPMDMDLLSPLAYLPMGRELREALETKATAADLPEDSE